MNYSLCDFNINHNINVIFFVEFFVVVLTPSPSCFECVNELNDRNKLHFCKNNQVNTKMFFSPFVRTHLYLL